MISGCNNFLKVPTFHNLLYLPRPTLLSKTYPLTKTYPAFQTLPNFPKPTHFPKPTLLSKTNLTFQILLHFPKLTPLSKTNPPFQNSPNFLKFFILTQSTPRISAWESGNRNPFAFGMPYYKSLSLFYDLQGNLGLSVPPTSDVQQDRSGSIQKRPCQHH